MSFNQLSSLKRHMNTHKKRPLNNDSSYVNPKRPCTSQETNQLSDHISQCNWCHQHKNLIKDKPYCLDCSKKGRECRHCIRPLPEKFYCRINVNICDTCSSKRDNYLKRIQVGGCKISLKGAVETKEILPNNQNMCDPLHFFNENKNIYKRLFRRKNRRKKWNQMATYITSTVY